MDEEHAGEREERLAVWLRGEWRREGDVGVRAVRCSRGRSQRGPGNTKACNAPLSSSAACFEPAPVAFAPFALVKARQSASMTFTRASVIGASPCASLHSRISSRSRPAQSDGVPARTSAGRLESLALLALVPFPRNLLTHRPCTPHQLELVPDQKASLPTVPARPRVSRAPDRQRRESTYHAFEHAEHFSVASRPHSSHMPSFCPKWNREVILARVC